MPGAELKAAAGLAFTMLGKRSPITKIQPAIGKGFSFLSDPFQMKRHPQQVLNPILNLLLLFLVKKCNHWNIAQIIII